MTNLLTIHLPWLDPKLSPNARTHWSVKAKRIRIDRDTAHMMALSMIDGWQREVAQAADVLVLRVAFHEPDKRRRDKQNMPASGTVKAYIDGIADALGIDDSKFQPVFAYGEVIKGGRVVIEVNA